MQNNTPKKKDWSLWLGLAIPLVMMLFIALSIYVPRIFDDTPPPATDFLYTSNASSWGNYSMQDNEVVWNKYDRNNPRGDKPRLYVYNVSEASSREVSFAEAQQLSLDSRQVSPDGYRTERSRRHGVFFFDGGSARQIYLIKGRAAHKLDPVTDQMNYYSFKFLAWVVE